MDTSKRIIIVSNRLPIKLSKKENSFTYHTSEGGLATALGSVYKMNDNLWIGWPGLTVEESDEQAIVIELAKDNLYPVFLDETDLEQYYEGFSNETLWPLFHYFPSYTTYDPTYWEYYKSVNKKFADAILKFATEEDIIWIHDYQLMLVPQLVRDVLPNANIGFFNHIPFPSYEIFRSLPWRAELLNGVLGADVIGFHTYDDVRHFLSSNIRINGHMSTANEITVSNRKVTVDAFPISIDFVKYNSLTEESATIQNEQKIRKITNGRKLFISIDRLDYSKGIINRLRAFELLLKTHPELCEKIVLVHVVVPSRDNVSKYKELKQEMDRIISDINGRYGALNWQPIIHLYRSLSINLLSALYKCSDVALVTPLRDGMNLVSKEFVASKQECNGVLILSEMAGAARELSDAVLINPTDIWDFSEKMYRALTMSEKEMETRMYNMRKIVSKFNIQNWLKNYISRLIETKNSQKQMETNFIDREQTITISKEYQAAKKRLIILDYDGTLVPFYDQIDQAYPSNELNNLLSELCNDPHNTIVIASGRDHETLDNWLGHHSINLIAEHGAIFKNAGGTWETSLPMDSDWKNGLYNTLDNYCRRTPGTFIEEKSFSLAWHYRQADAGLGELRAQELIADIKHLTADLGLNILNGDKVVEIKSIAVNKGNAVKKFLNEDYSLVIAIGDDVTDEDTFKAVPDGSLTIKVGKALSVANYHLRSVDDVLSLLNTMVTQNSSITLQ
jgi:trehalose 6-phosphate synthase/phosphatase